MRSPRRVGTVALVAIAAFGLAGCFAPATDAARPATPTSAAVLPSPTPTPAPTLAFPTDTVSGEVAFASVDSLSDVPVVGSTTGPGLLDRSRPYYVEGVCVGPGEAAFELTMATGDRAGEQILGGSFACGTPIKDTSSELVDWTGPVQLRFTDTDGVQLGWMRVVQE